MNINIYDHMTQFDHWVLAPEGGSKYASIEFETLKDRLLTLRDMNCALVLVFDDDANAINFRALPDEVSNG